MESKNGKTVHDMKVNGEMERQMGMAVFITRMVMLMRETGLTIRQKVEELILMRMVLSM